MNKLFQNILFYEIKLIIIVITIVIIIINISYKSPSGKNRMCKKLQPMAAALQAIAPLKIGTQA